MKILKITVIIVFISVLSVNAQQEKMRLAILDLRPKNISAPTASLVLQKDSNNNPIHVVWGIQTRTDESAVLIIAYRPDPLIWEKDYITRRKNEKIKS